VLTRTSWFSYSFPAREMPSYQRHIQPCNMPEISENSDKLSIKTITQQSREWRIMVLVELYFNTLGELIHLAAKLFFLVI
jgi:hypothetical protein